jgi:hypothetical protein
MAGWVFRSSSALHGKCRGESGLHPHESCPRRVD